MFENMSLAQWEQTSCSKIESSWNLHTLLPELDFFILLSSVSGVVGNPGQSNYAAGCTFQDALARHRNQGGQKAVSASFSCSTRRRSQRCALFVFSTKNLALQIT